MADRSSSTKAEGSAPDDAPADPASPVAPARSGWRSGLDAWTILEVAGALAVLAVVLWPVTAHPVERLAGQLDAPYHAWLGWRIAELWRHGGLLTFTIPDAFSPMGFDLRLVDGLLPGWVTACFDLLTGGRLVLSYNLALATGLALDLWAGRRLAKVLSSRRWVPFAVGVAFATAPAVAGSVQAHLAFVYAFTLPLLVREAILVARGDRAVRWYVLAPLLVVAYLCSAYHLVFGGLSFVLVVTTWPRSAVWSREAWGRLALAALVTVIVLSPFIAARISYEHDERAAGAPDVVRLNESVAFSADALGMVTPNDGLWLPVPVPHADLGPQLYAPLRPAFAGYALLAGFVLTCFARVAARRPFLVTTGVLWVLSLGPALHVAGNLVGGSTTDPALVLPYRVLQSIPGLGALRAPTRASYALAAVLAACLAVGLDALLDRLAARPAARRWEVAIAVATGVLLLCSLTAPIQTSDLGTTAETQRGLEEISRRSVGPARDREGLLIVPWGCRLDDPRIIALQSIHRMPNVGCNPPPTATRWFSGLDAWAGSAELAALRCDPAHIDRRPVAVVPHEQFDGWFVARLRSDLGVRFVVVDRGLLPPVGCDGPRQAAALFEGFEVVSDDGTWEIVDLDRPVGARSR